MNMFQLSSGIMGSGCKEKTNEDTYVLVKTHHQSTETWAPIFDVLSTQSKMWNRISADIKWRMKHLVSMEGRAVVLIRNPYEAIISFWQHDRSQSYDKPVKRGVKDLQKTLKTEMFRDFVKLEIGLWEEIYVDFLSYCSRVLVIHYEHMKNNLAEGLEKMHEFLEVPVDPERLKCVKENTYDNFKRKHIVDYGNPYDEKLTAMIEKSIRNVQTILTRRKLEPLPLSLYKYRKEACQP